MEQQRSNLLSSSRLILQTAIETLSFTKINNDLDIIPCLERKNRERTTSVMIGLDLNVPPLDVESYRDAVASFVDSNKKIIIVGAGITGLYAAYTLECLGCTSYEILEARG
jgi:hypothetical protein